VDALDSILTEALKTLRPTSEERRKVQSVINLVVERVSSKIRNLGVEAEVSVQGSVAKDTWISGDKDIDVFIMLPKWLGQEGLEKTGMEIARYAAGANYIEGYAEHPYVQALIEDYRVDIVPCFKVEKPEGLISAVDRTPFHTLFINERLNDTLRDEVRLLKGFAKGIGVYGAEIKTGGLSGYLCELLTLYYGSFKSTLLAIAKWKPFKVFVDIQRYYGDLKEPLTQFKQYPLVVIDPVDKRRNVAAALTLQRMSELIAASRAFIERPSITFFKPPPRRSLTVKELEDLLANHGASVIVILTECPKLPPDVLWGQIHKSLEGLVTLLRSYDFNLLRASSWSNEKRWIAFTVELESHLIPKVKKHQGPLVTSGSDSINRFLKKHVGSPSVISGPLIEGDRWVVFKARPYVDARKLIMDKLLQAKLGVYIAEKLSKGFEIYVNDEIKSLHRLGEDFTKYLASFLDGRPNWLK